MSRYMLDVYQLTVLELFTCNCYLEHRHNLILFENAFI
jgi:hypothetical protein